MSSQEMHGDVAVLGGGPGGYTAAFRLADLGKKVILIERNDQLGGVCLNVGCIPSKTYLHAVSVMDEAAFISDKGISYTPPKIDREALRQWKNRIVTRLTMGLQSLAKQRKVEVVKGIGQFITPNQIQVERASESVCISFTQAIVAAGSEPRLLPHAPTDPRIMDSTGALDLADIPHDLLVVGAGVIGMEMATVYSRLGSHVTLVDMTPQIIPGADTDLIAPLFKRMQTHCQILLETQLHHIDVKPDGLYVTLKTHDQLTDPKRYDRLLYSIGRVPNGHRIGADRAGISVDSRGFISVDKQQRTNVPHIYAIGDIVGNPMLAHKAVAEGRIAAEVAAGLPSQFNARCIPSVAYTDPEVAFAGITETEAKAKGLAYQTGIFPWMACGRAWSLGRTEGITKLLFNDKNQIIGAGMVGVHAGELIGELALAIEKGCTARDIAHTIHPHPTLSETIMQASEVVEGTVTDLIANKR